MGLSKKEHKPVVQAVEETKPDKKRKGKSKTVFTSQQGTASPNVRKTKLGQ